MKRFLLWHQFELAGDAAFPSRDTGVLGETLSKRVSRDTQVRKREGMTPNSARSLWVSTFGGQWGTRNPAGSARDDGGVWRRVRGNIKYIRYML